MKFPADFNKLWAGQTISELGSRITREGIPLTAVLYLNASSTQMGFLAGIGGLAMLLVSLPAGVHADRVSRRPIMIATDIARALLLASIPLAAFHHRLGMLQLYIVAALAGVLTILFDIAYQSYVPSLVSLDAIVQANSRLALSSSVAEMVGPGLTGMLVQLLTAPIAILFDALSFLVSAVSVWSIKQPEPPQPPPSQIRVWAEIREGLTAVWEQPILRLFALRAASAGIFQGIFGGLYTIYAIRELGLTPIWFGVAITIGGIGNMLGAVIARRVERLAGLGATLFGSIVVFGLGTLLIPLGHRPLVFAMACLIGQQILGDCGYTVFAIHELSLRQSLAPDRLLGRINSCMQMVSRGIWPLGALVSGVLADRIGLRPAMLIGAVGVLVSSLWFLAPAIRNLKEYPPSISA